MKNNEIKKKIKYWAEKLNLVQGSDRIEYIIDQGKKLPLLDNKFKIDNFKIHGCASSLWLVPKFTSKTLELNADADAFITKGTAFIILDILSGNSYEAIKDVAIEDFKPLDMKSILTPQRQNGLGNLILTIKKYAEQK
ncbi:MAG: SufE family protein [Candidatus Fonsibacter sp.]|jgi:cysteine desulfuration protein SufE